MQSLERMHKTLCPPCTTPCQFTNGKKTPRSGVYRAHEVGKGSREAVPRMSPTCPPRACRIRGRPLAGAMAFGSGPHPGGFYSSFSLTFHANHSHPEQRLGTVPSPSWLRALITAAFPGPWSRRCTSGLLGSKSGSGKPGH